VVKVRAGEILSQQHGSEKDTTNNRMELTALINGLEMIAVDEIITVYTDSELCCNILTKWALAGKKRLEAKNRADCQS